MDLCTIKHMFLIGQDRPSDPKHKSGPEKSKL